MFNAGVRGARRLAPLRAYLAALVAAVLLPALGVGAAALQMAVQSQRAAFENGLRDTARALSLAVDAEFTGVTAALAAFVTSPAFGPDPAEPDLAAVDAQARRIAERIGAALYLARRDGTRLLTTRQPPGAPLPPLAGMTLVERVFATGRPAVGDLVTGSVSGAPSIAIGMPVADAAGQVVLAAGASFDATRLADLLAAQARGESFATLVDSRDIIVARSREHARFAGLPPMDWVLRETEGREAGILLGPNRSGEMSLSAFHRLAAAPGWMAIVGAPVAARDAAVWRAVRALAGGGLAVLAVALAAALGIGALVLRPVRDLTRLAEAVAAGDEAAVRAPRPSRVAEFEQLRRATIRAERTLRAERDRARLYFDVAGAMLLVLGPDGTVRAVNRRGLEVLGLAHEHEAVGRDWIEGFVPARLRAEIRHVFAAVAAGRAAPDSFGHYENPVLRADGTERLVAWRNAALRDATGTLIAVVSSGEDITEARAAEAHQRMLALEVDHRAKNVLSVVQSILRLTPADDPAAFRAAVEMRVAALGRAHGLLAGQGWRAAALRTLLEGELAAHQGPETAIRLEGPAFPVAPGAAQPLAMMLHELATNAAKHGAFSAPGGQVTVAWCADPPEATEGALRLRWAEQGGPVLAGAPVRRGFGSRVIEAVVRGQLGGTIVRHWDATGLVVEATLPLSRVLAAEEAAAPT